MIHVVNGIGLVKLMDGQKMGGTKRKNKIGKEGVLQREKQEAALGSVRNGKQRAERIKTEAEGRSEVGGTRDVRRYRRAPVKKAAKLSWVALIRKGTDRQKQQAAFSLG
ncbi:hypothetical protein ACFX1S_038125 [Malus domestica]